MTTTSANPRLTRWVFILIAMHVVVICMVVVLLMRTVPASTVTPQEPSATDQLLARIADAIEAGQWDTAYDHLNAAMILAGQVHLVAIAPYSAAGVQGAAALTERVEAAVDRLSRAGSWVYNRKALTEIDSIGKHAALTHLQKLEGLAKIREERLGDYAQSQFGKAWQGAFDELKAEEDKKKAAQLRIVRSLTP